MATTGPDKYRHGLLKITTWDVTPMARRLGLCVVVAATLLTASACGGASEVPSTPAAVAASTATEPLTPAPVVSRTPTAAPSRVPGSSPTPRPSRSLRPSAVPSAASTTRKATPAATTSNKAACDALEGPLEKAVAGLIVLREVASGGAAESTITSARAEAITRLVALETTANRVAGEQADRTLRSNVRALAVTAGLKYTKIRSIKPTQVDALQLAAGDTGDLEDTVAKLEPACGRYW
ncbi:hypothetical protein COO58_21175 [Micromonospora sp. WMMA1996]|uniref:hypothetical protein n=1 Tax=Micromonospora sp. WMMA1996 TaxID=2039878 RepID=UPI000BF91B85|nr:hypothetical protein [Micromonospora sp. WMMA1996]PGH42234.1 hypothetical protein COO58_21175 [Micromonospora sp. WMMA1996]